MLTVHMTNELQVPVGMQGYGCNHQVELSELQVASEVLPLPQFYSDSLSLVEQVVSETSLKPPYPWQSHGGVPPGKLEEHHSDFLYQETVVASRAASVEILVRMEATEEKYY